MSTVKRKAKVVMLPTSEKANIVLKKNGGLVLLPDGHIGTKPSKLTQPQHLYILSDDEIKEDDWFIMNECIIRQCKSTNNQPHTIHTVVDTTEGIHHVSVCKKIIASTDKSLKRNTYVFDREDILYNDSISQPSQAFIQKFIEAYNSGNPITDVMVEYENINTTKKEDYEYKNGKSNLNYTWRAKVNPKDNTITITKVKDSWSREEVKEFAYHILGHFAAKHDIYMDGQEISEYLKQNL